MSSQVALFLQALQDTQVFQAFQNNPISLSAQYGIRLSPSLANTIHRHLQGCMSLQDAQKMGQSGFRLNDPNGTSDGWGGGGKVIACPGGRQPTQIPPLV